MARRTGQQGHTQYLTESVKGPRLLQAGMAGERDGRAAGEQRWGPQIWPQIQAACMIGMTMAEQDRVNGR